MWPVVFSEPDVTANKATAVTVFEVLLKPTADVATVPPFTEIASSPVA